MKTILLLWFLLPISGYVAGYTVANEQLENMQLEKYTNCSSPQHEGESTIGTLVKREGGLVLVCEKHSTIHSTHSPNRGEKK